MKYFICNIIAILFLIVTVNSQTVFLAGTAPNNYIVHKVVPKESWFSIGRLYNINARELANYNKIPLEKGLNIEQVIKVPITASNRIDSKTTLAAGEVAVPLYYLVGKSEGLYRIANNFGTTMQAIRDWNSMQNDQLSTGAQIQVGLLKVKESESTLSANKTAMPAAPKNPEVQPTQPIVNEPPVKEVPKEDPPKPKVTTPPVSETPKVNPKPTQPTIEETKPLKEEQSFFKTEYGKNALQGKSIEGKGASFKTMAGWDDNKFYALMDGITPGTIVQIINPANGKVIFAKILGEMQEIKQNHGLLLRISNAAASALDIQDEKFTIGIKY